MPDRRQASGLRLIDTRTWFSRTLEARAFWFNVHIVGAVGSRTRAVDLRTRKVRMLPARVAYLL